MTLAIPVSSSRSLWSSACAGERSKPAGVAQRRLLLEVPAGTARRRRLGHRPGVHHLAGQRRRVRRRLPGHRDAVLDLGAHDPPHAHAPTLGRAVAPDDARTRGGRGPASAVQSRRSRTSSLRTDQQGMSRTAIAARPRPSRRCRTGSVSPASVSSDQPVANAPRRSASRRMRERRRSSVGAAAITRHAAPCAGISSQRQVQRVRIGAGIADDADDADLQARRWRRRGAGTGLARNDHSRVDRLVQQSAASSTHRPGRPRHLRHSRSRTSRRGAEAGRIPGGASADRLRIPRGADAAASTSGPTSTPFIVSVDDLAGDGRRRTQLDAPHDDGRSPATPRNRLAAHASVAAQRRSR